ncbi:MAG: sulfur oxidation c-type cytochrome SoxX [Gammaproteobacteria bacterium]
MPRLIDQCSALTLTVLAMITLGAVPASAHAAEAANPTLPPPEPYCTWAVDDFRISAPLCGLSGDAERGKVIATRGDRGNCLACHRLPVEGVEAYGTIGPPLAGIGSRYDVGSIRMRVVDMKQINPMSIMPGFYRDPGLIYRPARALKGRTFLTAQQVEDVVAYLVTLK